MKTTCIFFLGSLESLNYNITDFNVFQIVIILIFVFLLQDSAPEDAREAQRSWGDACGDDPHLDSNSICSSDLTRPVEAETFQIISGLIHSLFKTIVSVFGKLWFYTELWLSTVYSMCLLMVALIFTMNTLVQYQTPPRNGTWTTTHIISISLS